MWKVGTQRNIKVAKHQQNFFSVSGLEETPGRKVACFWWVSRLVSLSSVFNNDLHYIHTKPACILFAFCPSTWSSKATIWCSSALFRLAPPADFTDAIYRSILPKSICLWFRTLKRNFHIIPHALMPDLQKILLDQLIVLEEPPCQVLLPARGVDDVWSCKTSASAAGLSTCETLDFWRLDEDPVM